MLGLEINLYSVFRCQNCGKYDTDKIEVTFRKLLSRNNIIMVLQGHSVQYVFFERLYI